MIRTWLLLWSPPNTKNRRDSNIKLDLSQRPAAHLNHQLVVLGLLYAWARQGKAAVQLLRMI